MFHSVLKKRAYEWSKLIRRNLSGSSPPESWLFLSLFAIAFSLYFYISKLSFWGFFAQTSILYTPELVNCDIVPGTHTNPASLFL